MEAHLAHLGTRLVYNNVFNMLYHKILIMLQDAEVEAHVVRLGTRLV